MTGTKCIINWDTFQWGACFSWQADFGKVVGDSLFSQLALIIITQEKVAMCNSVAMKVNENIVIFVVSPTSGY